MQQKFENHLDNLLEEHNINQDVFAVGVSGGADSLALAYLLKEWNKAKIVVLTVDHGLREESAKEAEYVAGLMKKIGVEHHVLRWEGDKPAQGMEEAARNARYDLMEKWCVEHEVRGLMIAHHMLDQAETFLMRLQRGSGVDGLAAMLEVSDRGGIRIIRPLLSFRPEELRDFLEEKRVEWVNDPHNEMDDFLRVRIRKLIPDLEEKIGLSAERLADTAKRMARARDYLHCQTDRFIKNSVRSFEGKAFSFSVKGFFDLHEEIALRALAQMLMQAGEKSYSPRMDSLESLYSAMFEENFKSQTLSDCEVIRFQNRFWIVPEFKMKEAVPVCCWEKFVEKNPEYKKMKLPHKLRLCLIKREPIL